MKKEIIRGGFTALLLMTAATAASASDLDDNKVVRDQHDQVVRSIEFENCVRTEWEAGNDACAPAEEVVEKRVVQVPRTLEKADKTVYFEFDKAVLTPESQQRLDAMSNVLRNAGDVRKANIVGYADPIGSTSYNQALSLKRAQTVKKYMADRGYFNTSVAEVRGLGETDMYGKCQGITERAKRIACLQPNRRVEVELEYLQ